MLLSHCSSWNVKKINLDNIKLCVGGKAVKVPCKEFAIKYERYVKEIENTIDNTI